MLRKSQKKEFTIETTTLYKNHQKLLDLLKKYDTTTYSHSIRIAQNASIISDKTTLIEIDPNIFSIGCAVHDIGKLNISLEIINKPNDLSEEEKSIIKSHPNYGVHYVTDMPLDIQMCVLLHHEREDGSGYPFGLTGNQIPNFCKILSILDVLDALTSQRSYNIPITSYEKLYETMKKSRLNNYYLEQIMNLVKYGSLITEKEISK